MALKILSTEKSPYIFCDEGHVEIKGRSILDNPDIFFVPLEEWLERYFQDNHEYTLVEIQIEYSNSNSNKFLFKLLSLFESAYHKGQSLKIKWYYESDDDTQKELGIDYQSILDVPFELALFPRKNQ